MESMVKGLYPRFFNEWCFGNLLVCSDFN